MQITDPADLIIIYCLERMHSSQFCIFKHGVSFLDKKFDSDYKNSLDLGFVFFFFACFDVISI